MTAPAAPVITSYPSSEDTIVLAWPSVANATDYNVYEGSTEHPTGVQDSLADPADAQADGSFLWESPAITPGSKAYFRVTALNAGAEESSYSNEVGYGYPTPALNANRRG